MDIKIGTMKFINENMMKCLSFPDFEVEKIELSLQKKFLKIYVEGAWINIKWRLSTR